MKKDIKNTVLVILGGGMIKDASSWRTTSYKDLGDNFGLDGHRLRVEAAAILQKRNHDWMVLASGGKGQMKDVADAPTLAVLIKRELIGLGLNPRLIIEENKSGTTYEQLLFLNKMCKEGSFGKMHIVSNNWHLPRVRAMIENVPDLDTLKMRLDNDLILDDADQILLDERSKEWGEIIADTRKSPAYSERLKIEEKGVKDILSGKYKFKK